MRTGIWDAASWVAVAGGAAAGAGGAAAGAGLAGGRGSDARNHPTGKPWAFGSGAGDRGGSDERNNPTGKPWAFGSGAGAGVANVEPRNEGPGNPQRPTSGPARVVSFPCPSFPCPFVRIGRLPIITAWPKHGVPPSWCLPGCVQAAQHHPVAVEKSRSTAEDRRRH
jgi:hypothetical protein